MKELKTYMETKYQKKLEDMTYYQLLRHVCGSQKEYLKARKELDPLLAKIAEKIHKPYILGKDI